MSERIARKYTENFFKMGQPCNFPGCEQLRQQYTKELRETMKPMSGCAACRRTGLVSKYKSIIRNRITLN